MSIINTIIKFDNQMALALDGGYDRYLDLKTNLIEIKEKVDLLLEDNTIIEGIYVEDILDR